MIERQGFFWEDDGPEGPSSLGQEPVLPNKKPPRQISLGKMMPR